MKIIFPLYVIILCSVLAFAQSEYMVNSTLDSTQREPAIARDSNGNYVVVWTSEAQAAPNSKGDIFFQLFDNQDQTIGTETAVNSVTAGDQEKPAVGMSPSGDFVIVWASFTNDSESYDISAQIYKNNQISGSNFTVNSTTAHSQSRPDVAMHEDGSFVVVWDSWFQDGSDRGIYAQRFDMNGNKNGSEIQVNSTTAYSQTRPAVAVTPDGGFIVIWESWKQDIVTPSGYGIYAQRFDSSGSATGNEFQVNTYTNDYQWLGDLLTFDDGSFVVVWCSWEQDGDDGGIYLQEFNDQGNRQGNEIRVNKSTNYYQWLPKLARTGPDKYAIVWSSWKQDGDREGVYGRIFEKGGKAVTFEERLNLTTNNFQWEPVAVAGESDLELVTVWSSWGQMNADYEVIGRRVMLSPPEGIINPTTIQHPSGNTTSEFLVHVFDSTALTGDLYELTFTTPDSFPDSMKIENRNSGMTVVSGFPLAGGTGLFYMTPIFEGVAVEIRPVFTLDINSQTSVFLNHTGSNLTFDISAVNDNFKRIAPIDAVLIWGNTDTLSNGQYANPLDTALSIAAKFEVQVPFRAWNITDNQPLDLWIIESSTGYNQRWDPDEAIRILTPPPVKVGFADSHAQILPGLPSGNVILPGPGDSVMVYTSRPFSAEDTLHFRTDPAYIVTGIAGTVNTVPKTIELEPNYPNPFNPTTTIAYTLPAGGKMKLSVYNVLGQRVTTLVEGYRPAGRHRILFDGSGLASGIYFYTLTQDHHSLSRKMILVK